MFDMRSFRKDAPAGQDRLDIIRRTLALARPYRVRLMVLVGLVSVAAVLELMPAVVIGQFIDEAVTGIAGEQPDLRFIGILFGLTVVMYAASALFQLAVDYHNQVIGQGIMFDIRQALHLHLQRLSLHFFTSTRTGDILSRLSTDVNAINEAVTASFTSLLHAFISLAVAFTVMLYLDWRLAVIAAVVLPLWSIPMWKVGERMRRLQAAWQEEAAEMSTQLEETLSVSGAMVVRAFGRQEYESERFRRTSQRMRELAVRRILVSRWFYVGARMFGSIAIAVAYAWGARGIADSTLTVGEVITFALLTQRVFGPFAQIAQINTVLLGSQALFERIFQYLDTSVEVREADDPVELNDAKGEIEFHDVSFSYPSTEELALRGVSFSANPGQMIALVGPSGAGKTTVAYLAQRFYDPVEGIVTIDGHDMRQLSNRSVSQAVGAVMQETTLFYTTLRNNVLYGRPEATDEAIWAAVEAAGLQPLIERLPDGLETLVGERGYRLSGGEKQRVAIARALLKDPPILILDEATSSLDTKLESEIREATERLTRGRTTIVIAHRLSTVMNADQILVIRRGEVVERGRHAELVHAGGLYSSLHGAQFANGEPAAPATR